MIHPYSAKKSFLEKKIYYNIQNGFSQKCLSLFTPYGDILTLLSIAINSLPKDKILDWSKLKAFADNKINVNEKLKFGLGRIENIVGNGENAGYQHFLLIQQCFHKATFPGLLKTGLCGKRLTHSHTVTPLDAPGKQAF